MCLLYFDVETELYNKQYIIQKLLNINSNQSKDNGMKNNGNTDMFQNNSKSKGNPPNMLTIKTKIENQTKILMKEIHQKRR